MKPKALRLAATAAITAAIAATPSCKDSSPADNNTIAFSVVNGGATYRMAGSADDLERDSDMICYDTACVVMPTVVFNHDITALQDTILKIAFDTVCPDHREAMLSSFGHSFDELGYDAVKIPTRSDERLNADGLTMVKGEVFSLNGKYLTYCISSYLYTPGAAHGVTNKTYLTYYMPSARIIGLSDLFTAEGLKELPRVIAAKARKMRSQLGPTDITALPDQDNFYIALDYTIVFVYQPYEVASYAQGEIAVPFDPYQLAEYMTPFGQKLFNMEPDSEN